MGSTRIVVPSLTRPVTPAASASVVSGCFPPRGNDALDAWLKCDLNPDYSSSNKWAASALKNALIWSQVTSRRSSGIASASASSKNVRLRSR